MRNTPLHWLGILLLLVATSANAASIVVNSTVDASAPVVDANCTFREALLSSNGNASVGGCTAGSGTDTITFSVTGTITVVADAGLPNITSPVIIDGPGGGSVAPTVRIDGATLSTSGSDDEWGLRLVAGSAGSTVRDLMITRFNDGGIWVESANNLFLGNWIGTNGATAGLGNGAATSGGGIKIQVPFVAPVTVSGNTVGGTNPVDRNLIEGNQGPAIGVYDFVTGDAFTVQNTTIQGNYFNTNPAGTATGPNGGSFSSVIASFQATNLTIGGTAGTTPGGSCTGACNLISEGGNPLINFGDPSDGTSVSGIAVRGNFIGTDVTGTVALGCAAATSCAAFQIPFAVSGAIGGPSPAARNVIAGLSGPNGVGIQITNTNQLNSNVSPWTVEGNYIGVGSTGLALPNGSHGMLVLSSEGVIIGGATAASRNVISANAGDGIRISGGSDLLAVGNTVRQNYIGVLPDGVTAAGNGGRGVALENAFPGFTEFALVQENIIANNAGSGVTVGNIAQNNRILANSLYNNGPIGIDLNDNGVVDANDNCDADTNGNDGQNFPVLTTAGVASGNVTVTGTLNSLANSTFRIEFFGNTAGSDEGRVFLGFTTATTDGACSAAFAFGPVATSLVAGNTVTATATNSAAANSDTSELSAAITAVTVLGAPTVTKSFTPASIPAGGVSTLSIQIANPNASPLTGVAFTDTYPAQIATAAAPNITGTCGGGTTGSTAGSFTLSSGTIAANSSCTVTIDVTSATVGGPYPNNVTVTSNAPNGAGSAGLTVTALSAPTITKSFTPASITSGATSTLTIQIANANPVSLTNVAFTDTYPAQMTTAAAPSITNTCGGATGSTAGTFTLSGGGVPASGSCAVSIAVTSATVGGPYTNNVTVTSNAPNGVGSAGLTVTALAAPTITKSFAPASITSGGTSTLSIQIANSNAVALTGVAFTDTYPAQITTAAAPNITNTCGGATGSTAATFSLSGGGVPANSSCTVSIAVTSTTVGGPYTNNVTVTSNAPNGLGSAGLTVTALAAPTISKSFTPASITSGGTSTLSIQIANSNAVALTGVAFTDTYPAQITTAAAPNLTNSCGGVAGSTAGTFTLSGASVPASGSCTVSIAVTSTTAGGPYTNNVTVTSNAPDGLGSAALTVTALQAPTITKSFAPSSIVTNGTSTLSIQIANPNAMALSNVAFTDTYPAQITTAAAPNITGTCGGVPGSTAGSFTLTGGTVPASGSCTLTIDVTSSTAGGPYTNNVTVTSNAPNGVGSANLSVSALPAPTVTKSFAPATIATNGVSTLSIQISNTSASAISNIAFTDTYPAGVQTAAAPAITGTCNGGTTGSTAGTFTLTGGSLAGNASCTVTVNVTSATPGAHLNSVTVTSNAASGSGSASLIVLARPSVSKSFAPDPLATNAPSTLTILLGNTNAVSITGVNMTDTFPAGLVVATPNALVNGCGGSATAVAGSGSVSLTGGTILNGGCSVTVNVTSATAATYTNTIPTTNVTSTNAGSPTAPASDTVTFSSALTGAKVFAPSSIGPGGTSTLTVTLSNPNPVAATGVGYVDTYPAAITNAAVPNASTTCGGGSVTAAANGTSHQASGLTIPAASSCTVTVTVTASAVGAHTNTIPAGAIVSSNLGAATAATSATLTVNAPPTIAKAFAPATIPINGTSLLTVTLTNPNAAPLTAAAFTDTYPAGMINGTPANPASTCGGVVTAANGGPSVALTGGTIPANGSCTVTVSVTATAAGVMQNTTSPLTTANSAPSAAAATAGITVTTPLINSTPQTIPALSTWMLGLLGLLLAGGAAIVVRRRSV